MNRFQYRITADDQTAKGVGSAEKRMGGLTKAAARYGKEVRKAAKEGPGGKGGLTAVKGAMDQVQRASGRLAASVPGVSRYTSVLGDVHKAASDAARGVKEASSSGSGLASALGGIVAAGGGAVGIVAALTAGAIKLASGWAEGGAQLGRLSAGLGVSTDDLQRFQAVGERSGVSKEETTSAVGGLASTLHEAKFGRNNDALYMLRQLGIGIRTKADGSVDAAAEMYDVADAIASRKDPQTQARIAAALGVSSALPMLRLGSPEMRRQMSDAGKYAAIMSSQDVTDASRIWGKGQVQKQLIGRSGMLVEAKAARGTEGGLDASIATDKAGFDGGVAGAARAVAHAASAGVGTLGGQAKWAGGEVAKFGGVVGRVAGDLASRIEHLGERSRQDQVSPKGARGVMQVMPGTARDVAHKHGIAWDEGRYRSDAAYSRQLGTAYINDMLQRYGGDETLATAAYNAGPGAVDGWIKRFGDPRKGRISDADFAARIPYAETRKYVGRVEGGDQRLVLEVHGLPPGARVTARKREGGSVAVGMATVGGDHG